MNRNLNMDRNVKQAILMGGQKWEGVVNEEGEGG
jgi:hypothetical protein